MTIFYSLFMVLDISFHYEPIAFTKEHSIFIDMAASSAGFMLPSVLPYYEDAGPSYAGKAIAAETAQCLERI